MARQTHIVHSEDPVRVTVEPLNINDLSWFRMFRSIVHSGTWAKLTPAAAKVLVVLAECVNDSIRKEQSRWIAWPSIATIGTRAGVERRAAQKAIALLEEHGLVRRCRRRNAARGDYSNEYELTPPPAHADAHGGVNEHAQGGATADAPPPASRNARGQRSDKRSPSAPARAQQSTDKTEYSDDSSNSGRKEVIRAQLTRAGIGEPVLSRLIENESESDLLLRLKDWETRKRAGSKLGVAWLIASIQQKYELDVRTQRTIEDESNAKRRSIKREMELVRDLEENARQQEIDRQAQVMFDEMSDEELIHWKGIVREEYPGVIRNIDRADPRENEKLRRLILAKLGHLVCPPAPK